jgi:thymidylate synthase (FAD)
MSLDETSKEFDILPKNNKIMLYDDLGFVELVDMKPRMIPIGYTADKRIADAARTSYLGTGKSKDQDDKLVRRLFKDKHTSPFELVVFNFHIKLPLFVNQQLLRHRTASLNQASYRYISPKEEIYYPDVRMQHKSNKQCSSDETVDDEKILNEWDEMKQLGIRCMKSYKKLVDMGVAREVARIGLPAGLMTELIWSMDLHNLLHFLKLRMANDAQLEIRELADAIYKLIKQVVPVTCEAFEEN